MSLLLENIPGVVCQTDDCLMSGKKTGTARRAFNAGVRKARLSWYHTERK